MIKKFSIIYTNTYWLTLVGITATVAFSEPDLYHHRNILPGARAAALGGAYTAVSDDPSGCFYNPSGLAFGKKKEISISANSRHEKTIRYKNIEALNGQNFVENSTTFFPSFVGTTYKFGFLAMGWSYMTLDAANIDQSDRFEKLNESNENILKSYNRTHQESNSYFLAGGHLALPIGNHFAIGASTFYYRRDIIASNHQLLQLTDGSFITSDQKYTTLNEGIYPIYGALAKIGEISIGFSYRNPKNISDNTTLYSDQIQYNSSTTPIINSKIYSVTSNEEINPTTTQLGLAWTPSTAFLISADIIQHNAKKSATKFAEFDLVETYNYAAGIETGFSIFKLRAGYFTNNSQAKKPQTSKKNQPTHIDYIGTAFSISIHQKGFGGSIVFSEQNGTGQSQKISESTNIQDVESYSRTIQLGANYEF